MRVVNLHKLDFDESRFEADVACLEDDGQQDQFRAQMRSNHENAWLVVVEGDGALDFGRFAHPEPGPNAQAPWLEQVLSDSGGVTRAAFFLHYVDVSKPLFMASKNSSGPCQPPHRPIWWSRWSTLRRIDPPGDA